MTTFHHAPCDDPAFTLRHGQWIAKPVVASTLTQLDPNTTIKGYPAAYIQIANTGQAKTLCLTHVATGKESVINSVSTTGGA